MSETQPEGTVGRSTASSGSKSELDKGKSLGVGLRVRCRICRDEVQSPAVGVFVRCSCGAVGVDAQMPGPDAQTRIVGNPADWERLDGSQF